MVFESTQLINIQYYQAHELIPMGRLALKDRQIFFEYAPSFLELGLELSPFKLPLKPGVHCCEDRIFEGLFGVFNDSLPDGWGRLLLDRKLIKSGMNPNQLTPLDRLRYVGSQGMGALCYEPGLEEPTLHQAFEDLDFISHECQSFQEHDTEQYLEDLLALTGSSGGMRPKILVHLLQPHNQLEFSDHQPRPQAEDWIVKFRSTRDALDSGPIEYAYHLMAAAAGLQVPEARLFESKTGPGYFGVKRFDRKQNNFLHMHTLSGLLHIDHQMPLLDYQTLMQTTLRLTQNIQECEKQFRHAAFNVLAHNRDDHAKNFCFLMDPQGVWSVSPPYDLTFSSGPGGEHCTTIMGEGQNPTLNHLLKLAEIASIDNKKALHIIDEVKEGVLKWKTFAKKAGVQKTTMQNIQSTLISIL